MFLLQCVAAEILVLKLSSILFSLDFRSLLMSKWSTCMDGWFITSKGYQMVGGWPLALTSFKILRLHLPGLVHLPIQRAILFAHTAVKRAAEKNTLGQKRVVAFDFDGRWRMRFEKENKNPGTQCMVYLPTLGWSLMVNVGKYAIYII